MSADVQPVPTLPASAAAPASDAPASRRLGTFASLRVPNYRLFFAGMLVSNTGLWISRVAQDWLVLMILTPQSSTALGLVTALQFLPMPLLAPFAGALADRFPKRRLLMLTQSASALTSALLATLVIAGHVQLWHVFALALAQGTLNALDNPTRQAFVSELVDPAHLTNAVGLNSASFHAARLLGPAVGGLSIAAFGVGPSFVVNAISFAAVLLALRFMDADQLMPAAAKPGRGGVRAGLSYVRGRPDIMLVMFMAFMLGLSSLTAMTTANAAVQLGTDPGMRGRVMALYMAVFMGGTPLGSPIVGWVGDAFGPRWTLLIGAFAVGLSVLAALGYHVRRGTLTLDAVRAALQVLRARPLWPGARRGSS